MELWIAFSIALIGAIIITTAAYPLIVWIACKLHERGP